MEVKEFNRLLDRSPRDYKAYKKLYDIYYSRAVYHLCCCRYTKEAAEDAVQEFFSQLPEISKTSEYIETPTKWILNYCEHIANAQNCDGFLELSQDVLGDSGITYIPYNEFEDVLSLLDDGNDKKILRMYYLEGYNFKEIGKQLNISYNAVRQRAHRTIKKLGEDSKKQSQINIYRYLASRKTKD